MNESHFFSCSSHMKQFISAVGFIYVSAEKCTSQYVALVNNFAGAQMKRESLKH